MFPSPPILVLALPWVELGVAVSDVATEPPPTTTHGDGDVLCANKLAGITSNEYTLRFSSQTLLILHYLRECCRTNDIITTLMASKTKNIDFLVKRCIKHQTHVFSSKSRII